MNKKIFFINFLPTFDKNIKMSTKKDPRGRKKLPVKDKKVPVYIMVPLKHKGKAQKEIDPVAVKYCN